MMKSARETATGITLYGNGRRARSAGVRRASLILDIGNLANVSTLFANLRPSGTFLRPPEIGKKTIWYPCLSPLDTQDRPLYFIVSVLKSDAPYHLSKFSYNWD